MTGSKIIAYAIWAAILAPAAILALWLGFVEWSWRGFLTAFVALMLICALYGIFERWVARLLRGPVDRRGPGQRANS